MISLQPKLLPRARRPNLRAAIPIAALFLLIEFFDELPWAVEGAALPVVRRDLALSYAQVGVLLGVPAVAASALEPTLMLLGDTRWRRALILAGGIFLALALASAAVSQGFPLLLAALAVSAPASGAFVTLSQATLMDLSPGRQPQAMARWSLAGSVGSLLGSVLIAALMFLGGSWRWSFVGLAAASLLLVGLLAVRRDLSPSDARRRQDGFPSLLEGLWKALTDRALLRWILLLEVSDLMLDVFTAYVPLYFTDVVGASAAQASLALAGLTAASLAADVLAVPLLERFPGRRVVRVSAAFAAVLYPAWLWLPGLAPKLALLMLLGLSRMGWYAVLRGEAYATRPGRSGTVMAVTALAGLIAGGLSAGVGYAAEQVGLGRAQWFLLAAPLTLVIFLPSSRRGVQ